jgi:FixJ family two-component response regulator
VNYIAYDLIACDKKGSGNSFDPLRDDERDGGRSHVRGNENESTAHADRLPTPPVAKLETARPRAPPNWRETAGNSVPARKQQERPRRIKSVQEARRRPRDNCPVRPRAFQGPFNPRLRSQPGSDVTSLAAEGMSMVSNGARNNIGAALARSSQDPVIFIIDDDVAVREALQSLLRDVCVQAEVFGSPTELLASRQPDAASCLVLDIRLPGMSGLDFQAQLARANIDIPVIFITGYADIPMAVRAMKAGAVDFLTKPFREQDMLDAVAAAIARDRMRRESERVASEMRARFETLSAREREVMALVTRGSMNKQVAARTGLAEPTVKMHRGQAMRKMGAKSLVDLVKMAEILGTRINSDFRRSPNIQSERRPANTASRTPFSVRTWPSNVTGKMIAPTRESPESRTRFF